MSGKSIILQPLEIQSLEKVLAKSTADLTLLDIYSFLNHTTTALAESSNETSAWYLFHRQFEKELIRQNNKGWPEFVLIKKKRWSRVKDQSQMVALPKIGSYFIKSSDNIMTLILRLLYVENYKGGMSILVTLTLREVVDTLTLESLDMEREQSVNIAFPLKLVGIFVSYYLKIYTEWEDLEHQVALLVLDRLGTTN